jgi:thiamine pyrophosphate-dependent acetolactate synthase large subunit-like protein
MARMRGGQAVIECLRAEGVERVLGIVGNGALDILDAFYGRQDIAWVGVRHEQAGVLMADASARVTGRPAACLVTSGPGAANLSLGLAQAFVAHSPVVAIAGGPDSSHYDREGFLELDLPALFRPVTKLSIRVGRTDRVADQLRHAFRVACSGRMGPVFVEVPRDVQHGETDFDAVERGRYRMVDSRPEGDAASAATAARLLASSERPVVLAGGGVTWSGAESEVAALADDLGAALVASFAHNDAVPNDHPRFLGILGRSGSPEAAETVREADVVLVVGCRLGFRTSFWDDRYLRPGVRLIQVDVEPAAIGRHRPVDVGIVGDARAVAARLRGLVSAGAAGSTAVWRQTVEDRARSRIARLAAEAAATASARPIKPQHVIHEIARVAPADTVFTLEAGAVCGMGYDRLRPGAPRSFLATFDLASLGVSFPLALGAKLARPDRPVISLNGDGGFLFNIQELQTAVEYGIAAVAVVMNNGEWGSEKVQQKYRFGGRYVGADTQNPPYDRLAEVFGARGFRCEHPDQVGDVIREALACGRPSVVEIPVDPEELPAPDDGRR